MKKILLAVLLCALSGVVLAQGTNFKMTTITNIQTVSQDSLLKADTLGIGSTRWLTQTSPLKDSLVEVIALVVVPPRFITYSAGGRTMVLTDTGSLAGKPFSHIFVRYPTGNPTVPGREANFELNGYNSIKRGDIIQIRGKITEFPTTSGQAMNSLTQFEPDTNQSIIILSSNNPIPEAIPATISMFNVGANPGGTVKFSTGEQWEAGRVVFTNLTVTAIVNTNRGTFQVVDANGNYFSMYDWSKYFTIGGTGSGAHGGSEAVQPAEPKYLQPFIGQKIDTLFGFISTSSGGESTRGYRICPVFPGDMKLATTVPPSLGVHRRNPVVVSSDTVPEISVKTYVQTSAQLSGAPLKTRKVWYSVNNAAWVSVLLPAQSSVDSIAKVKLPKQVAGTVVKYFIEVVDSAGQTAILANSSALTPADSSKGLFYYKVLDRTAQPLLSIQDVQYTPFKTGNSPYIGAVDSVGGIVTADTASLYKTAFSQGGTTTYYMQSSNSPYSGLWFVGPDSVCAKVVVGDSVVVTGTVSEFNDVTELFPVTSVRVISKGNTVPSPLVFKTEQFGAGVGNGDFTAEPYEGMLVRFDSVTVTTVVDAVYQDVYQYEVTNSVKQILVARDGKNTYTNNPLDSGVVGKKMLRVGNKIKSLTGILYYNGNRYKVVPRTDADFGIVTSVGIQKTDIVPNTYSVSQNYPNPFNPSTTIQYSIPVAGNVVLKVYNAIGQEVSTVVNQYHTAGTYTINFNASRLSSGIYFYSISSGSFHQVKKMVLLK